MFLLFIHTGQYRKCTSVRERRTRHQKGPRAGTLSRITQSTTTLYAQGSCSNILSEFEETFLLKILNAFHSRLRFSCVKNFLWLSTKLRQSYPLPRHGFCCRFHSQTVQHVLTAQMYKSLVMRHISKTCFHRNYRFPPK